MGDGLHHTLKETNRVEMTYDLIVKSLIDRIRNEYGVEDELNENTDVMELDAIDSLDRMNYMLFIEESFGVSIPDDKIEPGGIFIIGKTAEFILSSAIQLSK